MQSPSQDLFFFGHHCEAPRAAAISRRILCCLILPLTFFTTAHAANTLPSKINAILDQFPHPISIGVRIQEMDTGEVLYERDIDHFFIPASSLKLFTATAAEHYLGNDFTFTTEVLASRDPDAHNVLKGDVVFHFSGDPTLTREDLKGLVATLEDLGVKTITGNVYIDDSEFDQVSYGPGWMWDELNFCYAAPISSVVVGENCFSFYLHPGATKGDPAVIERDTDERFTPIINSVSTETGDDAEHCPLDLHASALNIYHLSGCIAKNAHEKKLDIAIKNVHEYTSSLLKSLFADYHINLKKEVLFGTPAKPTKILLASHNSQPLASLLTHMLKESDNLFANALYKKLGAKYFHHQGTWDNGARAIAAILSEPTGIDFRQISLVDGAGLSRYNQVTPRQLSALLYYIHHDADLLQTLLPALPESGIDGTLSKRMLDKNILGRVYAKTGTMTGGSSLAGYIVTDAGRTLSFVILINDYLGKARAYQQLEDAIVAASLQYEQAARYPGYYPRHGEEGRGAAISPGNRAEIAAPLRGSQ